MKNKIKRYNIESSPLSEDGTFKEVESNSGKWVKYDDIKHLINKKTCPTCKGKKYIKNDVTFMCERCWKCDGEGKV